jgi:rhodanese-related sulfurtransferase
MSLLQTLLSFLTGAPSAERLKPDAFKLALAGSPRPQLLDVRTASEFRSGHIQGARNLDVTSGAFAKGIASLSKDASLLVYCRSGHRSSMALSQLKAAGFGDMHHLSGGISAWQAQGFPVAK